MLTANIHTDNFSASRSHIFSSPFFPSWRWVPRRLDRDTDLSMPDTRFRRRCPKDPSRIPSVSRPFVMIVLSLRRRCCFLLYSHMGGCTSKGERERKSSYDVIFYAEPSLRKRKLGRLVNWSVLSDLWVSLGRSDRIGTRFYGNRLLLSLINSYFVPRLSIPNIFFVFEAVKNVHKYVSKNLPCINKPSWHLIYIRTYLFRIRRVESISFLVSAGCEK